MKKILLLFVIFCLTGVSCKDFLDTRSPSKMEPDEVYESEDNIYRAVVGIYSYLTSNSLYGSRYIKNYRVNTDCELRDTESDDAISVKGDDVGSYETSPLWGDPYNSWSTTYAATNFASMVISGIENSELFARTATDVPSNLMQMYGEAKCLRAILYFDLLRMWGDVPFSLEPTSEEGEYEMEATHRDTIMTRLIDDLIGIEPVMLTQADIQYGPLRATRSLCQGLIAYMALTRGGYALRPVENPTSGYIGEMVGTSPQERAFYYDLAARYAAKAIKEGNHSLKLGFKELWDDECNRKTPVGDDIVFDISFMKNAGGEIGYELGEKIDKGIHSYGKASGSAIFSPAYLLSFDRRDLRRDVTCQLHAVNNNLDETKEVGINKIRCGKWSKLRIDPPLGIDSEKGTGISYPWMRYAEILLMYAEAVNELEGPTASMHDCPITAAEAFKQVRRRAFAEADRAEMVEAYVDNLSDRESFFKAIVDERAWELGGENKRKFDLARWNLFTKRVRETFYDMLKMGMESQSTPVSNPYTYSRTYYAIPNYVAWKQMYDPSGMRTADNTRVRYVIDIGESLERNDNPEPSKASADGDSGRTGFCRSFWNGNGYPTDVLRRAYRGFIYWDRDAGRPVEVTNEVRYLLPIPERAIILHRGELKNNYGY